ncbi:hypothetical protein IMG5_062080 [Ichthyophthirius multifiliis]|uniref:Uncharacterized protein n=1 Tax=Ichthyophthirius multifiliis TaxID=5932 RepID=G0QNX1_ICHMU|nr:hypothetical protein IMG5_062080 [Ichthyophthirius multifiliis]EGR33086.1 hypothetical protein IMG5_062080 [Ichthyophthirius multifiliis]|eukprot:XP_004037072.1 hypothetical protein IMG5_062080 [Ichthyophthirius multifiliis]
MQIYFFFFILRGKLIQLKQIKINIILVIIEKNQKKITELIPQFNIDNFINDNNEIQLCQLINQLKQMGFPINKNMIYYFCQDAQIFINCGFDPLPDNITIPQEDYKNFTELKIKCKENQISLIHQVMFEENNYEQNNKNQEEKQKVPNQCRRTKERKIGYIIEKVVEWRNLYNGSIQEGEMKQNRLSLEEAANKVQISKKSLDDYLLQIRFGRKYGFNFNEHKNDKVGILRAFVKKHKEIKNQDKKKKRRKLNYLIKATQLNRNKKKVKIFKNDF